MDFQFDEKKLKYVQRVLNNRVLFKIVMLFQAPLDFMIGMRLRELNEKSCKVSVPYRWLNKNPFKSTFWAVLGMTAELSTGALVMMYTYKLNPSVAIIVGDCSGEFIAKAKDLTMFVCNDGERIAETVKKAIKTGDPQEVLCKTVGYSKAGEEVARFATTSAASICDNAPCEEVINVTAGENFTIELESNAGSTGFEWWNQFDTEYLSLVSSSELSGNAKPGWVGVPGKKLFEFSAKKPGSTQVIMLLLRPWENSTVEERKIFPVNIS